jgi:hypothetical protein
MALNVRTNAAWTFLETGTPDPGAAQFSGVLEHILEFTTGTAAFQADLIYVKERTVLSGANDDIDLSGVLVRPLGGTLTAVEIVGIFIINAPSYGGVANTTNLTMGAGTNPVVGYLGGTAPTIGPIRPNGMRMLLETDVAGLCPVVAATGDILRIANSAGASATYRIAILARSV